MRIEKITNNVLIGVEKEVETLRVKYKELHKNEIPIFNPVESRLKNLSCQLAKLNRIRYKKLNIDSTGSGSHFLKGKGAKKGGLMNSNIHRS